MVGQDVGEICGAEIAETGTDGLESGVCGREDSDIAEIVYRIDEVRAGERASQRRETSSDGSIRGALRNGEHFVNDMNDASSEVDVRCCHSRVIKESAEDIHRASTLHGLHPLTAGDIGVGGVC